MSRDPFPFHRPAGTVTPRSQDSYGALTGSGQSVKAAPTPGGPIPPGSFYARRHRLHWPDLLKIAAVAVALFLLAMSGVGYYDL